jgi:hypothetical protein
MQDHLMPRINLAGKRGLQWQQKHRLEATRAMKESSLAME